MIRYFDPGPLPLYFGVCTNEKSFKKEVKRLGVEAGPAFTKGGGFAAAHWFEKGCELTVIVCIDAKDMRKRCRNGVSALVAHEAVHVWQNVAKHMGGKHGQEIEAYSVQFFTNCVLSVIYPPEKK